MGTMTAIEITKKSVCIVKFGPAGFDTDGFRPAEYFQVTVDPSYVSPSGDYIRFGQNAGDEIQGWQRVKAITVIEVLAEWDGDVPPQIVCGHESVCLPHLESQQ